MLTLTVASTMLPPNKPQLLIGSMESHQQNLLDSFIQQVTETVWLQGLDLYQAGRVQKMADFGGLITALVSSTSESDLEVRLKIHPTGRRIQWLECTCSNYRRSGEYCQHIAAFMVNIDREHPKILKSLDSQLPLKPLPTRRKKPEKNNEDGATKPKFEKSTQAILSHLRGQIHSVSLLANGPAIRVRIEIKEGALTQYNLDIDAAPKFLLSHTDLELAAHEAQSLQVSSETARRGFKIFQDSDESIVVERILAIPHRNLSVDEQTDSTTICQTNDQFETYVIYDASHPNGHKGLFEFISAKSSAKHVGKEYLFVPDRGYWPIDNRSASPAWSDMPLRQTFKDDGAAQLIVSGYKDIRKYGTIWVEPSLDNSNIQIDPILDEIRIDRQQEGWFYLSPHYQVGTVQVPMIDLWNHFKQRKRQFYKSGKTWLKIPEFIRDSEWELDQSGEFFKVNAIGMIRLKASLGDFDRIVGSKKLLDQLRQQSEYSPSDDLPKLTHTKLSLRDYQHEGYSWMWWLHKNNLHGLLADEMGLGKTHQAMAILSALQIATAPQTSIVICPTSVIDHWINKLNEFCPNLNAVKHHGAKRISNFAKASKHVDVIVTSYGILLRDITPLSQISYGAVILDEAHYIKNNVTSTYRAVCRIDAKLRLCLTGTPMENHLGELKNIFDFLVPGYLGSERYFKKRFLEPISSGGAPEYEVALQKLIHPFKMRRTKDVVLKELPSKIEDVRTCELSKEQSRLYKGVLGAQAKSLLSQLRDDQQAIPYLHVFQVLTLLKQVCNHPALFNKSLAFSKHESGKFEVFTELLNEALGSNHKVVVYSQYLGMIKIFEDYLSSLKINHAVLTGKTKNRGAVVERFQSDPDCRVFCGSLMAGGIGIDLTAASVVIHYDRWWNASKENQASDRVHRIGQQKNVQIFKIITKGTLEEKIDALIARKHASFEKFIDQDEEVFSKLSRQEIIELLT